MTYNEAITTLETVSRRKKLYPIYLRMERMQLLFDALGLDIASPSVHIGGTSGKGSTSTLCAEVLQAAGYSVGLHMTPHLQTPRERMQVNGVMPSETEFANLVSTVYPTALHLEDTRSYGAYNSQEILFAIAALHFKRSNVDIAIVETFMGGQFDPTNVIKPLVSMITNVDLDHTRLLGRTVEAIAMVKAGLIKVGTPFITAAVQPSVVAIFKQRAKDVNAPYIVIGEQNKHQAKMLGQKGSVLSAQVLDNLFANLHLKLLGKHQINNAIQVLYIAQVLRSRGWLIPDEAIRLAFAHAFIPGRLEIVEENPLIILDGAHNPAKSKALAETLKRLFRKQKIVFVFAMKKGKNFEDTVKPLLPIAEKFIITRFSDKKSQTTSIIAKHLKQRGVSATTRLDPVDAIKLAKRQAKPNTIICVTGSLYLVGQVRNYWFPNAEKALPNFDDTAWANAVGEPIQRAEIESMQHKAGGIHARQKN